MSVQPADRAVAFAPSTVVDSQSHDSGAPIAADDALEFVRFCYRRRRVGWPALYDEMTAVAARATFRGMGYGDLAERGISFCLADLPRLVALTERVVREEQPIAEPISGAATLSLAPAGS